MNLLRAYLKNGVMLTGQVPRQDNGAEMDMNDITGCLRYHGFLIMPGYPQGEMAVYETEVIALDLYDPEETQRLMEKQQAEQEAKTKNKVGVTVLDFPGPQTKQ